jgi:hypothetical protein
MFKISKIKFGRFTKGFENLNSHSFKGVSKSNFSTLYFDLILPNLQKQKISIEDDSSLDDLEKEIKKHYKYEKIEFRTWDNAKIGKNNELSSIMSRNDPVFVKINTFEWQILNSEKFEYTNTEKYKVKEDFSHDVRSELKDVNKTVNKFNNNKSLTGKEIEEISFELFKIKHFHHNRDIRAIIDQYKNLDDIFENFYNLKHEYARLHALKEKLMKNCELKSKLLITLGGILFILELIGIYYGTFIVYSWDIVEPITFLLGCANLILILFFKKKFGTFGAFEYFSMKFFNRLIKKKKFDQLLFEETSKKLKQLEIIFNK